MSSYDNLSIQSYASEKKADQELGFEQQTRAEIDHINAEVQDDFKKLASYQELLAQIDNNETGDLTQIENPNSDHIFALITQYQQVRETSDNLRTSVTKDQDKLYAANPRKWRLQDHISTLERKLEDSNPIARIFIRSKIAEAQKQLRYIEEEKNRSTIRLKETEQTFHEVYEQSTSLKKQIIEEISREAKRLVVQRRKQYEKVFTEYCSHPEVTQDILRAHFESTIRSKIEYLAKEPIYDVDLERSLKNCAHIIETYPYLSKEQRRQSLRNYTINEAHGSDVYAELLGDSANTKLVSILTHVAGKSLEGYGAYLNNSSYSYFETPIRVMLSPTGSLVREEGVIDFASTPMTQIQFRDSSHPDIGLREMQWYIDMLSSPSINSIFHNELMELHAACYTQAMHKSLTDTEGGYIDLLRLYPTPDVIFQLAQLASSQMRSYRADHANWALTDLAKRSDWQELLEKALQAHPSLEKLMPILQSWNYGEHYPNPDLKGKTKALVLEALQQKGTDESIALALDVVTGNEDFTNEEVALLIQEADRVRYTSKEIDIIRILHTPEYKTFYEQLRKQADDPIWDAVIPDREAFWANNIDILVFLLKAGFNLNSFQRFRSIVNNRSISFAIQRESISVSNFILLREKIGVSLDNIYYTDEDSLSMLLNILDSDDQSRFYRRLLAQQPRSFKGTVVALRSEPALSTVDVTKRQTEDLIFMVLSDFGSITPTLLEKFILQANIDRRKEFIETLNEMRRRLFSNKPIKSYAAEHDITHETLAEYIVLTFPGNNYTEVLSQLSEVDDRGDDLQNLVIREKGYSGNSESGRKIVKIRAGQVVDNKSIGFVKTVFSKESEVSQENEDGKLAEQAFLRLIKEPLTTELWWGTHSNEAVAAVQTALGDKIDVFTQHVSFDTTQTDNMYNLLSRSVELFGIYYKDNASEAVEVFLQNNPDILMKMRQALSLKRIDQLTRDFAKLSPERKAQLEGITLGIKSALASGREADAQDVAGILAFLVEHRLFMGSKGLRKTIEKELSKFQIETETGKPISDADKFTAYVSKNAASFFAKQTAGVCTAGDTELFNRPDHFHINLVKDGEVVGNIQGYIIENFKTEEGAKPSRALLFRGFNPSVSFVSSTNAEIVCDQMIDVVKQIALDNGISDVFIPEQTFWHQLTNRTGEV